MSISTQQKIKLLSVEDRAILRKAFLKKFDNLSDNAYTQRVQGITPFSLQQRIIIDSWLEEIDGGRYQLKANETLLDLAGIPYPVEQ